MNSTNNQPLHLTAEQEKLKALVEAASAKLPRFVFRYWRDLSGGYPGLNTTTAIIPGAFSHHNKVTHPSQCFYHLSKNSIRRIADMHLWGHSGEHTVFSSWSQTLSTVLGMAWDPTGYVSILDTTLLSNANILLHTVQMKSMGLCSVAFDYELLAFGAISGPAYQAVSLLDFAKITTPLKSNPISEASSVRKALITLFRHNLRPAVAAHCIGLSAMVLDKELLFASLVGTNLQDGSLLLPADWNTDPKVMELERSFLHAYEPSKPAFQAAKLIRTLIQTDTQRAISKADAQAAKAGRAAEEKRAAKGEGSCQGTRGPSHRYEELGQQSIESQFLVVSWRGAD